MTTDIIDLAAHRRRRGLAPAPRVPAIGACVTIRDGRRRPVSGQVILVRDIATVYVRTRFGPELCHAANLTIW